MMGYVWGKDHDELFDLGWQVLDDRMLLAVGGHCLSGSPEHLGISGLGIEGRAQDHRIPSSAWGWGGGNRGIQPGQTGHVCAPGLADKVREGP